jgi:CRP-like cAMP-binding protein
MTEHEFAAGHVFFRPGDPADWAYLVDEGRVEVLAGGESATRVGLFEAGDVFGEMALVEERPRVFTARAVTAGRVTAMTRDEFEHQLLHDPIRARRYLRTLFERLRSLTARVGEEVEVVPIGELVRVQDPEPRAAWVVVIHPLTRKAAETLPDEGLRITRFPLRIGRATEANEPEAFDLNDLWLLDTMPFHVSRNHCEIDVASAGLLVRDRGSHLGCLVNDEPIGGRARVAYAPLEPGDNVLVLGGRMSPYQFRVSVTPA